MLSQKEEYFDISFVISGSLDWMSLSVPRQVLDQASCNFFLGLQLSGLSNRFLDLPCVNNHETQFHIYMRKRELFKLLRRLSGKESTCQCRRGKRYRFNTWVGKIPWSRNWQPTPAHPSILAWKIPWIEESGGLQSMRSQTVGYD